MTTTSHPVEGSEINIDEETRWSGNTDYTCSCVICGVPVFVVQDELRQRNYQRYKWWEPCAIHAQGYYYDAPDDSYWDKISGENHDVSVKIYGINEIEMEELHYGQNLPKLVNSGLDEYPYLVLHRKCLDILRRLVDYRKYFLNRGIHITGPNTLSQFHEVLAFRMTEPQSYMALHVPSVMNYGGSNRARTYRRAIEPHFYYFRDWKIYHDVEWPIGRKDVLEYEVEPFPIEGLTREILSHLLPLPKRVTQDHELPLFKLPTEMIEKIYDNLRPFVNPPLACTRTLAPEIWRDFLFHGRLLPWLWDLDPTMPLLHEGNDLWDWEQLVRQLAQVEVFEPGNPMSKAPLNLRNRRRIWRILEKAEFRDYLEWRKINVSNNYNASKAVPLD